MQTLSSQLETANTNVRNAYVHYSNALNSRDKTLYDEDNALLERAANVKSYVKALFGATSPEYNQISGILFKRPSE